MASTTGMFGYYPANGEHAQSVAHHTAALASLTQQVTCVKYSGRAFTTSGDEEQLLAQLLAVSDVHNSPYANTPPEHPPYEMGCTR